MQGIKRHENIGEEKCVNDLPSIACEINYKLLFPSLDDRLLWIHFQ
jgi:hypothetical protein